MRLTRVLASLSVVVLLGLTAVDSWASDGLRQPVALTSSLTPTKGGADQERSNPWHDLLGLPIAAALGAALAFRPVRRGTPARVPAVIQTQIVLAVVGALIMTVVGASLARAFGILGATHLVRYRSRIGDPKDAAVMLVALAVGLASGIGLYLPAAAGTIFILLLLWLLESIEPTPIKVFELRITGEHVADIKPKVERFLHEQHVSHEIRATGQDELSYRLDLPARRQTNRIATAVLALDPEGQITVELEPAKSKEKQS